MQVHEIAVQAAERIDVCKSCPRLFKPTMTCRECGCFMRIKVLLPGAECPVGKW